MENSEDELCRLPYGNPVASPCPPGVPRGPPNETVLVGYGVSQMQVCQHGGTPRTRGMHVRALRDM